MPYKDIIQKRKHTMEYKRANPDKVKIWNRNTRRNLWKNNPLKAKARQYSQRHYKLHDKCDMPGCKSTIGLQRHHWRYDQPQWINTLCDECHTFVHMKNGERIM